MIFEVGIFIGNTRLLCVLEKLKYHFDLFFFGHVGVCRCNEVEDLRTVTKAKKAGKPGKRRGGSRRIFPDRGAAKLRGANTIKQITQGIIIEKIRSAYKDRLLNEVVLSVAKACPLYNASFSLAHPSFSASTHVFP